MEFLLSLILESDIRYRECWVGLTGFAIFLVDRSDMALLRQATRFAGLARQCSRVAVAQQQQNRGYADMSFTFACPAEVSMQKSTLHRMTCNVAHGRANDLALPFSILAFLLKFVNNMFSNRF